MNRQIELYILQLQALIDKKSKRIIELCQQNAHLVLQNSTLKEEISLLRKELENAKTKF